jgi:50S ribosome-binding GTPase
MNLPISTRQLRLRTDSTTTHEMRLVLLGYGVTCCRDHSMWTSDQFSCHPNRARNCNSHICKRCFPSPYLYCSRLVVVTNIIVMIDRAPYLVPPTKSICCSNKMNKLGRSLGNRDLKKSSFVQNAYMLIKRRLIVFGLPNVGKSSLTNLSSGANHAEAANYPFCLSEFFAIGTRSKIPIPRIGYKYIFLPIPQLLDRHVEIVRQ